MTACQPGHQTLLHLHVLAAWAAWLQPQASLYGHAARSLMLWTPLVGHVKLCLCSLRTFWCTRQVRPCLLVNKVLVSRAHSSGGVVAASASDLNPKPFSMVIVCHALAARAAWWPRPLQT